MLAEIESFVNWVRRRNPTARTWRDYRSDLRHFSATVGDQPPGAVTLRDVDRFITQQAAQGYQPGTINRRLAASASFYAFLADEDPTLVCPVLPHRHTLRARQRLPRPVPAADLRQFFAVITAARDRAMFLLMLRCGLRIAEVAALTLPDLFLDEPQPRLLAHGKGSKERAVYLSPQAEQALRTYLAERPNVPADHVFLAEWTDMCRNALAKFRRFLRHERGLVESKVQPYVAEPHTAGLPDWLVRELTRYQHLRQANWRPARLAENICTFWSHQLRLWRWLCDQYGVTTLAEIKRAHVLAYLDQRLTAGYTARSVNQDLRAFQAFLRFLQENEYPVPQVLFRLRGLPEPDSLPRFLTHAEVRLLSADLAQRVAQAALPHQRRDALLDQATFYLMWQGGLRLGEVEELRLVDLNLAARQLTVHPGKGQHDRTVYLADSAVQALQAYLAVRGVGPTDHVFLYRNQPVCRDLLHSRIQAVGLRTGVKVYPHRLRHTCATQLLNAGCRITSIQKLLGHRRLDSTLLYARIHDQTVAADYFPAMTRVEQRLALGSQPAEPAHEPVNVTNLTPLLTLVDQLAVPTLEPTTRLVVVQQLRRLLTQAGTPLDASALPNARSANGHAPVATPTCPTPAL